MTPANAVCQRGKCASGWLRCLINPTPFSSVMLHSGLVVIADCVRYIVGHFDDGTCKSANLFLAQTPLVALSDFGKRPHHFVWSLCSCGQPCFRLKPAATVWHNLRPLLLRDQMLAGYISHFNLDSHTNSLIEQYWLNVSTLAHFIIFYTYDCSNQSSTNFNNLLIWSLTISPPIHLSWPTTELASLSASPKGLGISKNFGADATCCGNICATNPTCSQLANHTLTIPYQCIEIYSLRL